MEEMKPAAQDEQVFLRHGYAILPARSLPVGLVEAVQAQHSAGLLHGGTAVLNLVHI